MLHKLLRFGHKVLIFSQMTAVLDLMEQYLDMVGVSFYRLDGSSSLDERRDGGKIFEK